MQNTANAQRHINVIKESPRKKKTYSKRVGGYGEADGERAKGGKKKRARKKDGWMDEIKRTEVKDSGKWGERVKNRGSICVGAGSNNRCNPQASTVSLYLLLLTYRQKSYKK